MEHCSWFVLLSPKEQRVVENVIILFFSFLFFFAPPPPGREIYRCGSSAGGKGMRFAQLLRAGAVPEG